MSGLGSNSTAPANSIIPSSKLSPGNNPEGGVLNNAQDMQKSPTLVKEFKEDVDSNNNNNSRTNGSGGKESWQITIINKLFY